MPVMETYTGVQELPAPAAPAPRRARVSGPSSSRAERRQARSSSSRRQHPTRHSSDDSRTSSSSASSSHRGDGHAKLTDLFIDTKIEMMRMVETDLKLKLDVRAMKQCFYTLLQNFEAFEQQQIEQPEVASTLRRQAHLKRPAPGTHRPIRRRVSRASSAALEETTSSSSARCPNNTQASSAAGAGWAASTNNGTASLMVGDFSRSRFAGDETALSDVIGASRVENMSAITQCSNVTYREQCSQSRIMDAGGPLSSTIRYPQYSTPEKKRPRACPVSPIIASRVEDLQPATATTTTTTTQEEGTTDGHRRRLVYERPAPTGADAPAAATAPRSSRPAPRPAAALVHRTTGSDSDATPVAVRALTRLPGQAGDGYDSGMYGSDTPSTLGRHTNSRRQSNFRSVDGDDLSLEVVTPLPHHRFMESLKAMDGRMRRQTAQPDLSDELRSPVGLSETDLLDSSSFFANTILGLQCSTNATRASIANVSALSTSPLSPSSDVASSTGAESSYKESDATASSPPLVATSRNYSRKQQDARYHSRQMSTVSRTTSGTSTSSCGGFLAPSNSPNATSDSAASGKLPRERSTNSTRERRASHIKTNAVLGARPPCIGSDVMVVAGMPPPAARAASDPETSRVSRRPSADPRASLYAYARTARRETQLSGASSGGSTCSSDQSGAASSTNTSKESTISCIGVAMTPNNTRGVRRSLSKRIKKLGKKIMKSNSRAKAEAQHSI